MAEKIFTVREFVVGLHPFDEGSTVQVEVKVTWPDKPPPGMKVDPRLETIRSGMAAVFNYAKEAIQDEFPEVP